MFEYFHRVVSSTMHLHIDTAPKRLMHWTSSTSPHVALLLGGRVTTQPPPHEMTPRIASTGAVSPRTIKSALHLHFLSVSNVLTSGNLALRSYVHTCAYVSKCWREQQNGALHLAETRRGSKSGTKMALNGRFAKFVLTDNPLY